MTTQRWLIWDIHQRKWWGEFGDQMTQLVNEARRLDLDEAERMVSLSNFRNGNVPTLAIVPEPTQTLCKPYDC